MAKNKIAPTIQYKNEKVYTPNIEDYNNHFWRNNWLLRLTSQGIKFLVNANDKQDALNYVIDFCEEYLPTLIMSKKEEEKYEEEGTIQYYTCGGKHCLYLDTTNIGIDRIE